MMRCQRNKYFLVAWHKPTHHHAEPAIVFLSKVEHAQICRNRGLSIQAVLHSVDTNLHDLYEQ